MKTLKVSKDALTVSISLAQEIAINVSDERSAKFGYDIMNGIIQGNHVDRLNAWIEWYNNYMQGNRDSVDEERNGVWVPAIPIKP